MSISFYIKGQEKEVLNYANENGKMWLEILGYTFNQNDDNWTGIIKPDQLESKIQILLKFKTEVFEFEEYESEEDFGRGLQYTMEVVEDLLNMMLKAKNTSKDVYWG